MSQSAWMDRLPWLIAVALVSATIAAGAASTPRAVAGDLDTPADWRLITDTTGVVTFSVPPDWRTVLTTSDPPASAKLGAAKAADVGDPERGVTELLLDPDAEPAASVTASQQLAQELELSAAEDLLDAVGRVQTWSGRQWDGLFDELGCAPADNRPYVGVRLRGVAREYLGCHRRAGSSLLNVLAVDDARSVVVNAWFLAPRPVDRGVRNAVLGSLRINS